MSQTESNAQTQQDFTDAIIAQPTPAQRKRLAYYWPFAVSLVVIGLDQWTKKLVEEALGPLGSGKSIEVIPGQLRIIYIINKGASFGFLSGGGVSWVFGGLALLVSLGLIGWYVRSGTGNRWLQLGLGLVLGGIIGNLLDRIFQDGGVTDMITLPNVGIFKVFNVADSGITVGVTIVIATIILQGWFGKSRHEPEEKEIDRGI